MIGNNTHRQSLGWVLSSNFVDEISELGVEFVKEADATDFASNEGVNIGCCVSCLG